jgi:uncharacterized protein (DUF4415 family)
MSDDVTKVTLEDAKQAESKTDWERVKELTDEDIHEAVESDPDTYLLDDDWFETAEFVMPSSEKERITIRLDADILEFFRSEGSGYQSRINKVLREYMAVQRYKQTRSAEEE